jgi:TRAP-type C4-dicarboxylate transport system permease small subunit
MALTIVDRISKLLMVLAAVLAFCLCFLVVADVLGRVIFNHPVQGTPEIISLSIVVVCFLQTGYAIRSGGMLKVEAFTARLPSSIGRPLAALGALLGLFFFAVLVYGSFDGAIYAWQSDEFEGEGALRVPVWPAKFVIVLGCALASINYLIIFLKIIQGRQRLDEIETLD